MNGSKCVAGLSLVIALAGAWDAEARGGHAGARQGAQGKRIRQGVATGQLTGREAAGLAGDRAQNRAIIHRARSDGEVTGRERAGIEHQQDQTSKRIHNQKHDEQSGRPRGGSLPARDERQGNRIEQGVGSGALTGKEAEFLKRRDARIDAITKKLAQGGLTPQERLRLQHERDQLSRQIYHQKHDNQTAPAPEPAPADGGATP